jgi:hypothetical protein
MCVYACQKRAFAGNSFGIFPEDVRDGVCKQVQRVLADDGVFIVGFWCVVKARCIAKG